MISFKKSVLMLSLLAAAPAHSVNNPLSNLSAKETAKLMFWLANATSLGYYFFHQPDDRASQAPFERVLKGFFDNLFHDIFNWDNVTHFGDILPGQRWKVYSTILDGRSEFKIKLLTDPKRKNIKGFGLYHFCEKNMKKIVKYCAVLGISYGLLQGEIQANTRQFLDIILNAYRNANKIAQA